MSEQDRFKDLGKISRQDYVVNVFAVVKYFRKPTQTKGSDKSMFLTLVDPTLYENEKSLRCVFFEKNDENFPVITNVGDVVKFTSLKISLFKNQVQGQNNDRFSWITFDGRPSIPVVPRFSPRSPPTFSDADKRRVQELKSWAASISYLSPTQLRRSLDQALSDNLYFDLLCQVVGVGDWNEAKKSVVLHVWDGTCPAVSGLLSQNPGSFSTATHWNHKVLGKCVDVYVFREETDSGLTVKSGDYVQFTNLHLTFKKDVEEYESTGKAVANRATVKKIPFLMLHAGSTFGRGLKVMDSNDPDVVELKEKMDALPTPYVSMDDFYGANRPCNSAFDDNEGSKRVYVFDNPRIKFVANRSRNSTALHTQNDVSLASPNVDVGANSSAQTRPPVTVIQPTSIKALKKSNSVPGLFRCRANLFAYRPKQIVDFVKYVCYFCRKVFKPSEISDVLDPDVIRTCPNTECHGSLSSTLLFSLILRDYKAMIDVAVFDEDAKEFFPDIDPVVLLTDDGMQRELQQRMQYLRSNNVWMEYVIKSWQVQESEEPIVAYRVTKTRFPLEALKDQLSLTNS